jgi:aerobic-type carbon monoxide dehydrogenase small subunit (CoxS/CutS family)
MSVNGRMREHTRANSLLRFEYLRDVLGPTGTKSGCDGCESGACTVRWRAGRPCLYYAGIHLPSEMRLLEGLSQLLVANAFASNCARWRNSKPDNACVILIRIRSGINNPIPVAD